MQVSPSEVFIRVVANGHCADSFYLKWYICPIDYLFIVLTLSIGYNS